jgi:hypothetical protein
VGDCDGEEGLIGSRNNSSSSSQCCAAKEQEAEVMECESETDYLPLKGSGQCCKRRLVLEAKLDGTT